MISAQSKIKIPVAREANEITTRSLNFGSSTNQICTTSSTRSIEAQINTTVSGLSATTASTPSAVSDKVPTQLIGLGKCIRTTAVMMTPRHRVVRLKTNAHEIPSAIKVGASGKIVIGCQEANCRLVGICNCHTNTLIHATKAPPTANSQLWRKPGITIRNVKRVNAVNNKIRNVMRMDMQRQFYQVCPAPLDK